MATAGKVIKCKAVVAWEHGKPMSIEEVEVASPKEHEVRVKMVACGVCHSDWTYMNEMVPSRLSQFPVVLGHEGAGVVESVGPGVTKFSPGDKVIPLFVSQCGKCECCLSPKTNLCKQNWASGHQALLPDGTCRITCKGQQIRQFASIGCFSEYAVVPDINLAKIHPDAPLDLVFLLGCGISTGYGAAINCAKVEPGSTCAVFGLGAVGLAAVMGCKAAGAKKIFAIDINPDKFEKARQLGATDCVNPKDHSKPIQEVLIEMSNGGVDFALESVGSTVVMRSALESCRIGWGTCVIIGWTEAQELSLRPNDVLMGRTLKGAYFGGWKSVESVPMLVEEYMKGKLKVDEFVTHRLPMKDINKAFDMLITGKSIRTVITI
ncbi:alcohol dehydrogenase class-3-like [Denticeps clupeoides]|uniref:Enoyl reductase (ER) domain-containing protein n=1 Tax=Denticeps clupeoides TaxID=299321 RepID=A0AAY4C8G5_9TELE|nr:alcohol dehydrogenase class-3-like [Denticeps clupeoides]